jgi:hypothetical protein
MRAAATVRAAAEVRAVRAFAVRGLDRGLGHRRELRRGLVAIVEPRLRVDAEGRPLRAEVAGIGADHREAHRQGVGRAVATIDAAGCGHDTAVDAAVGLIEEAAVPGVRQAHLEADRVGVAVDRADALEHLAGDLAMCRHRISGDGERAGGDRIRAGDGGVRKGDARGEVGARGERRAGRRPELRQAVVVTAAAGAERGQQRAGADGA